MAEYQSCSLIGSRLQKLEGISNSSIRIPKINTHIFTMNLNLDSLMGASGLQSSLKWENSKQGFVRKSDRSIYNRTSVTQGVTWTCWSLMVNAEEMKTALVTQSVCQPFIKITQVFLKQMQSVHERIKDIPSRPFPLQVPLSSSQHQLLTPLFCRPVIKKL